MKIYRKTSETDGPETVLNWTNSETDIWTKRQTIIHYYTLGVNTTKYLTVVIDDKF